MIKLNLDLALSLLLLLTSNCTASLSAPAGTAPEVQRFHAYEKEKHQAAFVDYIDKVRIRLNNLWLPKAKESPKRAQPLITKIRLTIDGAGHLTDCKALETSGAPDNDNSICHFLISTTFDPLPFDSKELNVYLTFMTNGATSMVEHSDSAEAKAYYEKIFGGYMKPQGGANLTTVRPKSHLAEVDFGPYMGEFQRRLKRRWKPPKGEEYKKVTVVMTVHSDGKITDPHIQQSSGVAGADNAALKAVHDSSPAEPLPAGAPDHVEITFTFDKATFEGTGSF
ncbi:MAG TPA: TonB family protein [Chroococcales cyanobacterium]